MAKNPPKPFPFTFAPDISEVNKRSTLPAEDQGPQPPPAPTQIQVPQALRDSVPPVIQHTLANHIDNAAVLMHALNVLQMNEAQKDEQSLDATEKWLDAMSNELQAAIDQVVEINIKLAHTMQGIAKVREEWRTHLLHRSTDRMQRLSEIVGK